MRQYPMSDEAFAAFLSGSYTCSPCQAERELLVRAAMRVHSLTELPICGTGGANTGFFAEGRRSPSEGHS
jgi:hypothetical protein